jgi:quercetin dioxygenase-like cupin family protein
MLIPRHRWVSLPKTLTIAAAVLIGASMIRTQPLAAPAPHATARQLMTRDLVGMPGKEVVVTMVEYPPGASSPPHRHDAQVFVYVVQGHVIMQVKGGARMMLGPGQMFYENPTDIHSVSANASKTDPARFLAFVIKDKGTPGTIPVPPERAGQ